ncbi:MAG: VWA domain-containing protein [Thermoanaerobaculia bacterium]|nr:VWA domain-containing protein [Thermoanaerobaculia bacterium]
MRKLAPMFVLVGLLSATSSFAQTPNETTYGEVIEVHLVTVEVAVDSYFSRQPVGDLRRENFSVFEDGVPRVITHFERTQAGRVDLVQGASGEVLQANLQASSSSPTATAPRYVALAFDFGSLRLPYLARTVKAAQEFVRADRDETVEYSVMVLGHRPDVLLPFTSDREQVAQALDSLESIKKGEYLDSGGFSFQAPERFIQTLNYSTASGGGVGPGEFLSAAEGLGCKNVALNFGDMLAELFQGWPGGRGSKSLILFYEGEANGCDRLGVERGGLGDKHEVSDAFDTLSRMAAAAGIKVYATQGTGLNNPALRAAAAPRGENRTTGSPPTSLGDLSRQAYVDWVADRTGGQHINVNDLSRGIEVATTTARNHYLLSFQVDRAPDGKTHSLDIKVEGAGKATVRYPGSYDDLDGRTRLEAQLRTSANIPKRGGLLPMSVSVQTAPSDSDQLPIRALISVPVENLGLRWSPEDERPEVDLYVAVYGANGDLLEVQSEPWSFDPAALESGVVTQEYSMSLPAGDYTLSFAALDVVSGRYGVDYADIHP